jgi:hypothetical protein
LQKRTNRGFFVKSRDNQSYQGVFNSSHVRAPGRLTDGKPALEILPHSFVEDARKRYLLA